MGSRSLWSPWASGEGVPSSSFWRMCWSWRSLWLWYPLLNTSELAQQWYWCNWTSENLIRVFSCISSGINETTRKHRQNHQTGRTVPIWIRAAVAMSVFFGYEMDLSKLSDDEKKKVLKFHQISTKIMTYPLWWFLQIGQPIWKRCLLLLDAWLSRQVSSALEHCGH